MAWAFMGTKSEPSLKSRAMRFLARREHSREELRRKLAAKVAEGESLDAVLDELARQGWLSDTRFAEHMVRAKARRFGPLRLAQELRNRGVVAEDIAAGIRGAGADGEASIEAIWRRRFRAAPENEREKMRQVRFLQGRGFPVEEIFRFLKSMKGTTT